MRPTASAIALLLSMPLTACNSILGPGFELCFECSGGGSGTSNSPPVPALRFRIQPSDAEAGTPITPALEVVLLDLSGRLDTAYGGPMTITIPDTGRGTALLGTFQVTARAGVGVFDSLTIRQPRNGYRLWAWAFNYQEAMSESFAIFPAGAVVDQAQPVVDTVAPGLRFGSAPDESGLRVRRVAQLVTAGIAGNLVALRFPVACLSGPLAVEIQSVTHDSLVGDVPSGVTLAADTVPMVHPPFLRDYPHIYGQPLPTFRTIVVQTRMSVAAGDRLAIVLGSPGDCAVRQGPQGNPYPDGDAFEIDAWNPKGGWSPLGNWNGRADLPFETMVIRP